MVFLRNNVLTYYRDDARVDILTKLIPALAPAGILVTGAHERLPTAISGLVPLPECGISWKRFPQTPSDNRWSCRWRAALFGERLLGRSEVLKPLLRTPSPQGGSCFLWTLSTRLRRRDHRDHDREALPVFVREASNGSTRRRHARQLSCGGSGLPSYWQSKRPCRRPPGDDRNRRRLGHVSIIAGVCGHRITCSEADHALAFARPARFSTAAAAACRPFIGASLRVGSLDTVIGSELVYREADVPLERLFTCS
jgi:hypothetical protein